MIPDARGREVKTNGAIAGAEFGISLVDSTHVMTILRDTLYSDKVLAVLREYGANAWDANREAGRGDVPIEVTLPTAEDPTLSIRDRGPGLSRSDVLEVYTQYGRSTKRGTNSTVGMLGIGCKSGFAYADSFTVVSRHGGTESTYVAVLDDSEKGRVDLLHEEPCGPETGVEVRIAARPMDVGEFHEKAKRLFRHFEPRPKINVELPPPPAVRLKNGSIDPHGDNAWTAVMGCVPYRIDIEQVSKDVESSVFKVGGTLFFEIGEVDVNASREELKYSDATKRAIVEKFEALFEEYVVAFFDEIEKKRVSPWERRLAGQVLRNLGITVPDEHSRLLENYVDIDNEPRTFDIFCVENSGKKLLKIVGSSRQRTRTIAVKEKTRLVVRDDCKSISGYKQLVPWEDYVVCRAWRGWRNGAGDGEGAWVGVPPWPPPWPQVARDLERFLARHGMTGISVVKTSELEWTPPSKKNPPTPVDVARRKAQMFRWTPGAASYGPPLSRFWTPEERTSEDDDVYVDIDSYKVVDDRRFKEHYEKDVVVAAAFGRKVPAIFGYRRSSGEKRHGTPYREWRKRLVEEIAADPGFVFAHEIWCWRQQKHWGSNYERTAENVARLLGRAHPVAVFVRMSADALAFDNPRVDEIVESVRSQAPEKVKYGNSVCAVSLKKIYELYPILSIFPRRSGMSVCGVLSEDVDEWAKYIRTVDGSVDRGEKT